MVERRIALKVSDDEEINVAVRLGRALGIRAEKNDALGCEGTYEPVKRATE